MRRPEIVAHCDWSTSPKKRWMVVATHEPAGYVLDAPVQVLDALALIESLRRKAGLGVVFAGFDFPIGLPATYGAATGFANFRTALAAFGDAPQWAHWFDVANDADAISLHRPFYPRSPGGRKQSHLFDALRVENADGLRRLCEAATPDRRAACPLFWTLGGNQVGRAAIAGWQEVVKPALLQGAALWPFDGPLPRLMETAPVVIAETYPAEAYKHVGVNFRSGMSKRRQSDRASFANILSAWATQRGHRLLPALQDQIVAGFGGGPQGEDMFDALLGACGMLEVIGGRPTQPPASDLILTWEGWIIGQKAHA